VRLHRKFTHGQFPGAITLSGSAGDDAKLCKEEQVRLAIEEVEE
jgi:hypothetical protein